MRWWLSRQSWRPGHASQPRTNLRLMAVVRISCRRVLLGWLFNMPMNQKPVAARPVNAGWRATRGPRLQAKRPSQFGQRRQQLVRPAEQLDHDVVGAGPQMLA